MNVPIPDDRVADPLGHALLARRLEIIPDLLGEMAERPLTHVSGRSALAQRFLVTGTGSSEAHARFLVYLLNRHANRAAEFIPLSAFCEMPAASGRGRILVVISQGLSPNAQVAIDRQRDFDHTVVFTATTIAGAEAAGKPGRATKLRELENAGVEFIRSPLEEEYSTLIRFVGPLAVYLSLHQYVRCLAPDSLAPITRDTITRLLAARAPTPVVERFVAGTAEFRRGFYLLACSPLCEFAHNLSYKFLEGLFWSAPVVWDFLQFAHGPFQEVTLQPRPVVILDGPSRTGCELAARTRSILHSAGVPCIDMRVATDAPFCIFEFEAMFNDLVFQLIRRTGADQRNWPSKGRDDPLYGFSRVG